MKTTPYRRPECPACYGTGLFQDREDGYPLPSVECPFCVEDDHERDPEAERMGFDPETDVTEKMLAAEPCPDCGADPMVHAIDCDRMARYYE